MIKKIGKNISKNLSSKQRQKCIDHAKQSATDELKPASKRSIHKTAEESSDLIGNKISDKNTKVPRTSQKQLKVKQKIQDLIKKYQKKDIYLQKKGQKIINDLKLI